MKAPRQIGFVMLLAALLFGCKSSQVVQVQQLQDSTNGYLISMQPSHFEKGSQVEIMAHLSNDTPIFLFNGSAGQIAATSNGYGVDGWAYVVSPPAGVTSGTLTAQGRKGLLANSISYTVDAPKSSLPFTRCDVSLRGALVTHLSYTTYLHDSVSRPDTISYNFSTFRLPIEKDPSGNVGDTVIINYTLNTVGCPNSGYGNCTATRSRLVKALLDTMTRRIVSFELTEAYDEQAGLTRYASSTDLVSHDLNYTTNPDGSITAQVSGNTTASKLSKFYDYQQGNGGQAGRAPVTELNNFQGTLPSGGLTITLRP